MTPFFNFIGCALFLWFAVIRWYVLRHESWYNDFEHTFVAISTALYIGISLFRNDAVIHKGFLVLGIIVIFWTLVHISREMNLFPTDPLKYSFQLFINISTLFYTSIWFINSLQCIFSVPKCIVNDFI